MHLSNAVVALFAVPVLSYSTAASTSLLQLGANITRVNNYINDLQGCGFKNTTQAISSGGAASVSSNGGSACPSADSSIASKLVSLSSLIQSNLNTLKSSRSSKEVSNKQIASDFNDSFAPPFYALFNALDLAECTYILTTSSKSFAAQFGTNQSPLSLRDGFNAVVAELSSADLGTALSIAGNNFKQQTHFGGTSFLATQVGGPQILALAGCNLITSIVVSEGGGTS